MIIVVATKNLGKREELSRLLGGDIKITLKSIQDFPKLATLNIAETGQTYRQNATLKARVVADKTGLPTVADDTGLEVRSLDNFPGVNSARWMTGSDQERNIGLLKRLSSSKNRRAQFITVLCFIDPSSGFESCVEGTMKGKIGTVQRGTNGFGYDSLFIPEGYNSTFAQLALEEKNKISHRAIAVHKLAKLLKNKYGKLDTSPTSN